MSASTLPSGLAGAAAVVYRRNAHAAREHLATLDAYDHLAGLRPAQRGDVVAQILCGPDRNALIYDGALRGPDAIADYLESLKWRSEIPAEMLADVPAEVVAALIALSHLLYQLDTPRAPERSVADLVNVTTPDQPEQPRRVECRPPRRRVVRRTVSRPAADDPAPQRCKHGALVRASRQGGSIAAR